MKRSLCRDAFEDFFAGLRWAEGDARRAGTVYWDVPVRVYSEGWRSRRSGEER